MDAHIHLNLNINLSRFIYAREIKKNKALYYYYYYLNSKNYFYIFEGTCDLFSKIIKKYFFNYNYINLKKKKS